MIYLKKYSWLFLFSFAVGDFLIPYILELFDPNYHPLRQVISDLGENGSPVETAFSVTSIIAGMLLLMSLPGIYQVIATKNKRSGILLVCALGSFALGQCVLSGLFSVNRTQQEFDLSMVIHQVSSAIGTLGMLLVPLILAIFFRKINQGHRYKIYLIFFIVSVLFASINGLSQVLDFTFKGIWQRLSMLCMYLPVIYLAIALHSTKKRLV